MESRGTSHYKKVENVQYTESCKVVRVSTAWHAASLLLANSFGLWCNRSTGKRSSTGKLEGALLPPIVGELDRLCSKQWFSSCLNWFNCTRWLILVGVLSVRRLKPYCFPDLEQHIKFSAHAGTPTLFNWQHSNCHPRCAFPCCASFLVTSLQLFTPCLIYVHGDLSQVKPRGQAPSAQARSDWLF